VSAPPRTLLELLLNLGRSALMDFDSKLCFELELALGVDLLLVNSLG